MTTVEGVLPMEVENRYQNNNATKKTSNENEDPQLSSSTAVVFSPQLLSLYYSRLFPYDIIYQWLSYNNPKWFMNREFSFTIEPIPGEEVYIRYQSFPDADQLAAAVQKRNPVKIDIGAIFSNAPCDHNTRSIAPEYRELVFDIDLTDYDAVRNCGCSQAQICKICWNYMKMAVQVIEQGLREDFGFQFLYWFYSGRRGVHCWVCDPAARALTDPERASVAQYFELRLGTDKNKEMELPERMHPMLERAYKHLEPMFVQHILPAQGGHGLLATPEKCREFLDQLPEAANTVRDTLLSDKFRWDTTTHKSPAAKWNEFVKHLEEFLAKDKQAMKKQKTLTDEGRTRLKNLKYEIVFRHTYPRIDINVSKMRNHLLKSPFCVHPKTGRVCVPIPDIETFDPFTVPTLADLQSQLDQYQQNENHEEPDDNNEKNNQRKCDWQKTSLRQFFDPFLKEFLQPLQSELLRLQRDQEEQRAAITGDF
jgi:DNA primase small subunit